MLLGSVVAEVCIRERGSSVLRLMDKILHDPKDPKLWEIGYIP